MGIVVRIISDGLNRVSKTSVYDINEDIKKDLPGNIPGRCRSDYSRVMSSTTSPGS